VTVSTAGRDVPTHVRLEPDGQNGLARASFAKCEQVLTISKCRLERRLGRLAPADVEAINRALAIGLSL
jgi:mRNA-degrading endonuclease toxin of MazEF toxin-antitoxin module